MKERTDEAWLADLQSPDRGQSDLAWQELYGFLSKRLYYYLRCYNSIPQIAGDLQGHAEEIAQESLLKICLALRGGKYDPALARFLTWAAVIAQRTAIDALRRYLARPSLSMDELSETLASDPARSADPMRVDLRNFVHNVLVEELSDLQRTVCLLHYHCGYRNWEIAEALNKSDKAVEDVLRQVRIKFRRRALVEGFEL